MPIERPENLNMAEQEKNQEQKPVFEFEQLEQLEKFKGFRKQLWEKAKSLLTELDLTPPGEKHEKWAKETTEQIKGIENGSEDDESRFLDLQVTKEGQNLELRTIAQIDSKYNPDREKNYDEWDLTPQEEAERWLNREIIIGEKLTKYLSGEKNNLANKNKKLLVKMKTKLDKKIKEMKILNERRRIKNIKFS